LGLQENRQQLDNTNNVHVMQANIRTRALSHEPAKYTWPFFLAVTQEFPSPRLENLEDGTLCENCCATGTAWDAPPGMKAMPLRSRRGERHAAPPREAPWSAPPHGSSRLTERDNPRAQADKNHATCTTPCLKAGQAPAPATQKAAASTPSTPAQARHRSQPSAISATPATQSDDPCHQVPRLPRKVEVHVTKCHACHAKSRGQVVWGQVVCVCKLCAEKLCVDKLCEDKLVSNKVCVSKLCDDKLCDDKMCDDKLCDGKLCDDKLCVGKLCVSKL